LKSAFDTAAEKHGVANKLADIPRILDQDDVFVDIVDTPSVFSILLEILGGDIQLLQTQARIFPPGKTFTAPWHSDLELVNGIDMVHSTNFMVKVHYYPEDLTPEQGCLAFIPGSHRYPPGMARPDISPDLDHPTVVKVVPKAGDIVIFNVHLLHMALDNSSNRIRKSLIYAFSHFWVKNYPSAVPKDLERLATTPERRQLFGIPASTQEGSYFEQTLNRRKTRLNELMTDGRKLLSTAKRAYLAT
jgi:ectoine hydroxylase-related dioxygenase (phytanoyl-CoA dioxygenase family)